jgi:hypothetical protein
MELMNLLSTSHKNARIVCVNRIVQCVAAAECELRRMFTERKMNCRQAKIFDDLSQGSTHPKWNVERLVE